MEIMFFGFDGVRNHRRKRKARKVDIHFASTDYDRNGSFVSIVLLVCPGALAENAICVTLLTCPIGLG